MSVRAYKIKKIVSSPSFNCWNDDLIMDVCDLTNYNDGGLIYVSKIKIRALQRRLLKKQKHVNDSDLINQLEACDNILKDIGDEDSADYLCY